MADGKNELNVYTKEIRRAKIDSFREFCSELTSLSAGSRIYKAMANCRAQGASLLRLGTLTMSHSG